jgi:site-specific DNA-cytosine methylase
MLSYGSICSGVEAASLAFQPLGWRPAWFAEIDPFCSALLAHRFSDVPNHGDFTRIGRELNVEPVDLAIAQSAIHSRFQWCAGSANALR